MRTLLLDSSYFPVKIIHWQKAMVLLITGRAEVVLEYSDVAIRTVTRSFGLPKILKLNNRHQVDPIVRFTRLNVFLRDDYRCQYCRTEMQAKELTFDHVMPQSRGGKTTWENIVTACQPCNTKKANRTPEEASMRLIKKPRRPNWSVTLCLKIKDDDPTEWSEWFSKKISA